MPQFIVKICIFIMCIHNALTDEKPSQKPHIFILMADDMGFNDVSFHGSDQIPTPNIDALATFGIALNRYYVAPMCTPSRASLMTGKYPSNLGMQHFVIPSEQPWGLGLHQKIMPQYMKEGGYQTHLIGKWHLGFFEKQYTPLFRGFDSHFGYLGPYIDYYNHSLTRLGLPWKYNSGFDMRKNLSLHYETLGQYVTDVFTDVAVQTIQNHNKDIPLFMYISHMAPHTANANELQAPDETLKQFAYIQDERRRTYAAMVSKLDESVGKVVRALKESSMLENSIILFFSDNGAPIIGEHNNAGSNFPFKGQKDTPWEGAVHSAGAIWSPYLKNMQRVSKQLIHISDWLPTFAHVAGIKVHGKIDGHNVWEALSLDLKSPREDVLCNIDDAIAYSSYIRHEWKYVNGSTYSGKYDNWLCEENTEERHPSMNKYGETILQSEVGQALIAFSHNFDITHNHFMNASDVENLRAKFKITCQELEENQTEVLCEPIREPCLFNIIEDPCEKNNLAKQHPDVIKMMERRIAHFRRIALPARNKPSDPLSNPKYYNNTWTWWFTERGLSDYDELDGSSSIHESKIAFILQKYKNNAHSMKECSKLILVNFLLTVFVHFYFKYEK